MALNYVTLTVDLADGQGNIPSGGTASFVPSAVLTDAGVVIVTQAPVVVPFRGGAAPTVSLLATDNSGPQPTGWTWAVSFSGVPGNPAGFSFFLPFSGGSSQKLSSLSPVASGTAFQAYMPLPTGTASANEVPVATGIGEGSAWGTPPGGTPSGPAGGDLSGTYPNPAVAKINGTAFALPVSLANGGTGQASQQAAMDALAGAQTSGDYLRGNGTHVVMAAIQAADVPTLNQSTTGTAANITGTLDQVPAPAANVSLNSHKITNLTNGSASSDAAAFGQIPTSASQIGGVTSVAAGDTSIVVGGTSAAPTIETGTLDVIAGDHPPAGNWSNNSHKITSLANGGSAQDAAAWGQTVSGIGTTLGDTFYVNGTPAPVRLAGSTSATKQFYTQTGTGSVSAAPAWGTIASGDLPTGTTGAQGALQLDGTASDIQPTSTAASAGNKGQAADAKHVHVQNFGGLFGDGSDGAVTFDGSTTVLGLAPSSSTYTMTRPIFCTSITVNSGVTLKTNGWAVYCAGTITTLGTGAIACNGGNASGTNGATAGASAYGANAAPWSTTAGAAGGTGNGVQGSAISSAYGGGGCAAGGGSGASGGSHTGGAARTPTNNNTATAQAMRVPPGGMWAQIGNGTGGSGGAGGSAGGGDSTNNGGAGGGGGGIMLIAAWAISNAGSISCNGGNGGTCTTGNCGGGSGAGGGLLFIYTLTAITGAGSVTASAGSAGAGVGTGTTPSASSSGTVLQVVLA